MGNQENISYWRASTAPPVHPPLDGDREVDVAVIGGGIVGVVTAHLLRGRGLTVGLLEMDRVGSGVTGYTTAKVTAGHGLIYSQLASKHSPGIASAYAAAQVTGIDAIRGLVSDLDIDCALETKENYVYCHSDESLSKIEQEVAAARDAGLDARFTSDTPLPYGVAGAVVLADQAQFHPLDFVYGVAATIPGDGSFIAEHTRVGDVDENGGSCTIFTPGGTVHAGQVVVATNYPFLDRGLFFARVHPERSYALCGPADGVVPDGMFLSIDQPSRSLRTIQTDDGPLLLVGGEGHPVGEPQDTTERYAALERWAREAVGMTRVDHRWSTQDGTSADKLPYVGPLVPGSRTMFTATAFAKWGMTNGVVASRLLADLISGRDNEFASLYDPHRMTAKASAPSLAAANARVAVRFVRDRILHPQRGSLAELDPGEAAVARAGFGNIAAYRDEEGRLHAVSAVCTHLGCIVAWNSAEKSWDCPCHGSRYDHTGKVIQGPATRDLRAVDVADEG